MTHFRTGSAGSRHWPALTTFAQGYLHQDALADHRDATAIAHAFAADATPSEREALVRELDRLIDMAGGWDFDRLSQFFWIELGAAHSPASVTELRAMRSAVVQP
jgi:hypothetical protein